MKKSKLIVPAALAVMLLSTAASVTGTVAWFTANRAVDLEASKFQVTTTEGNLDVDITALANAKKVDKKTVTVAKVDDNDDLKGYLKLTDASVDLKWNNAANPTVDSFASVVQDDGDTFDKYNIPTSYVAVDGATHNYASGTDNVVLCVAWKITFTYTYGASAATGDIVNLFFNVEDSVFDNVDTHVENEGLENEATVKNDLRTGKGFRIGMATSTNAIVWADKETKVNCNYIETTAGEYTQINDISEANFAAKKAQYNTIYKVDNSGENPVYSSIASYGENEYSGNYYYLADDTYAPKADYVHFIESGTPAANETLVSAERTAPTYNADGTKKDDANWDAYQLAGASTNSTKKVQLVDSTVGYSGTENVAHTNLFAKATNTTENQSQRGDYLGSFTKAENSITATLDVYCYAWFEGTDPYVVNAETLNEMAASLKFYTRRDYVA